MSDITQEKSDKVCVVVGVGEGLGMALALRFAAGYKVALVARSPEVIGKTAGEIKAAGGVALPIQSDATIESEIAAAYERIKRELGPIENSNLQRRPASDGPFDGYHAAGVRGDLAIAYFRRIFVGAPGRA
jgi:NAD(P)-dependent dehydrogenase (short-subunit alcohol dehydrogenase family)